MTPLKQKNENIGWRNSKPVRDTKSKRELKQRKACYTVVKYVLVFRNTVTWNADSLGS